MQRDEMGGLKWQRRCGAGASDKAEKQGLPANSAEIARAGTSGARFARADQLTKVCFTRLEMQKYGIHTAATTTDGMICDAMVTSAGAFGLMNVGFIFAASRALSRMLTTNITITAVGAERFLAKK